MTYDWFDLVAENAVEQGDVFRSFDVPRVVRDGSGRYVARVTHGDYIVLSQTCDLENDKVNEVLLANVLSYDALCGSGGQNFRSTGFRKSIVRGVLPAYFLLPPHGEMSGWSWSIVDFHHLHLVEKVACEEYVKSSGPRLRLRSPYKEYLAQSYGRYMMRVALPSPLSAFESYKPA